MRIGVLALQGAFAEHQQALSALGVASCQIRQRRDLSRSLDGLIIPGGESTVQGKLLRDLELFEPLRRLLSDGLPVFGTCAGLLLLAQRIANDPQRHFALMDITAVRNGYGRQLGSFFTQADFAGLGPVPMTFIRAPYIQSAAAPVQVLARVNGRIVAARQANMLVTAFHPELNADQTVHRYFLDMLRQPTAL